MPKKTRTRQTKKATKSAAPYKGKKNPLFKNTPRNFGLGQHLPPQRDLTRFVKWPKYIKLQRQKRVLMKRLKVPPAINQFNLTLDKEWATRLFALLNKYRPETKYEKKERLKERAAAIAAAGEGETPDAVDGKPHVVKYGINHVTALIESKKAKLVVIAHDVDPIELVVWLPTLCRKKDVPYCIVKGKARLGTVVNQKTATCLAITTVKSGDRAELSALSSGIKEFFNDRQEDLRKQWGGGILGRKSRATLAKKRAEKRKQETGK